MHASVEYLEADRLEGRLLSAGYLLLQDPYRTADARWPQLNPRPDDGFTVAVQPDWTLREPFRNDYFITGQRSTGASLFLSEGERAFFSHALERRADEDLPPECVAFLEGPIAWLAEQIVAHHGFIFWSERRTPFGPMGGRQEDYTSLDCLCEILGTRAARSPEGPFALFFTATGESFLFDLLYESARASYFDEMIHDYFIADPAVRSVFMIHHHDHVSAVVPEDQLRRELVDQLRSRIGRFEDLSNYYDPEIDEDW